MQEPIDIMFEAVGTDLVFESFTIKGLANFFLDTLYNGEYKIEKQDFRFIVAAADCKQYEINESDLSFNFIDTTNGYRFFFKTTNLPEFDLTGMAEIKAAYQYKEPL